MKRTIGLAALMLTAVAAFAQPAAAFAQPAAAREDFHRRPVVVEHRVDYGRRPVVVRRVVTLRRDGCR